MKNPKPNLDFRFLYGTAWKEDLTESYVFDAIAAGYRGIDTANQRKHYNEQGVGKALARAYLELGLKREELFLQTKFTYARGQDHRKPYDEKAAFKIQVQQSFESSLQHLQTTYLDSYVLHGPYSYGITDADWETWESMQEHCKNGKVEHLGISNVSYEQLEELYEKVDIKPSFVQNRCFADTRWDKEVREFCLKNKIIYQGFSLLTANWRFFGGNVLHPEGRNIPHVVFGDGLHPKVAEIIEKTGKNIQQIVFRFSQQVGMLPITGTRSQLHMKSDLEISDFILSDAQLQTLENIAFL